MKIQPTTVTVSKNLTFGNKHFTTKLPGSLRAKPNHKVPTGFLIPLISFFSLLGFGTYYWQTHKEEAMQTYRLNILKNILEKLEITNQSDSTNTVNADTVPMKDAVVLQSKD